MQTQASFILLMFSVLSCHASFAADPLFDSHLHYNADDALAFSPKQIIETLDSHGISQAVITGTPASHTLTLYKSAPERIVPLLGVYRNRDDKRTWMHDKTLPARISRALANGPWRGIGELHIFASDRHSPVFRQLIGIAGRHGLPLLIHGDPAVIDTVFEIAPDQTVVWAHAGTFPYPDLIADYLRRYPSLFVDLSVRDEQLAPAGRISDDWYELFVKYPQRFMIGVDTYSTLRWQHYAEVASRIRHWLDQLPHEVARQIGHDNGARIYSRR